MNMRTHVVIPLFWLLLSPLGHAADSAPAPTQTRHGMTASEHAGSGHAGQGGHDHAAKGGLTGMEGAGGMSRPASWTSNPTLKTRMSGENRERMEITVVTKNIVADSVDAYSNDIKAATMHRQLSFTLAGARLDKPEIGGFHWLAAREEQDGKVRVASTVYFFSGSGKNPTAMFMQQKHELEIIPQPFPREHSRYRANEDWKFLVRFNSKPLANQKVNLETQNGTKTELLSDAQGMVTAHLPDDFKPETEQKIAGKYSRERRSSDFVLATEYAEGGKTYLTGFNSSYGPDAFDQRSLAMGLGFTLLGMIGATPLLRQRKPAKQATATRSSATAETAKKEEA